MDSARENSGRAESRELMGLSLREWPKVGAGRWGCERERADGDDTGTSGKPAEFWVIKYRPFSVQLCSHVCCWVGPSASATHCLIFNCKEPPDSESANRDSALHSST